MSIQRLDARHADEAAATSGEAFFDDPLLQLVAPEEATRRRWGAWFTSLTVQYGLRWGEVWCTDDVSADAAGVSCYLDTKTRSSIAVYTTRGFEIAGHVDLDGHTFTGMTGEPAARSAP